MALASSNTGLLPKPVMLHLPLSTYYHHKAMTICATGKKQPRIGKGKGPKINNVLRVAKRTEVREGNIASMTYKVEENKDRMVDDAPVLTTEAEATN